MADAFTDTTALTNLVETAFNKEVDIALHPEPVFRAAITAKKANAQAMRGDVVTFSIGKDLSPATTPLTEDVDVTAVAQLNPTRVSVTFQEYGNAMIHTIKLQNLAYVNIDPLAVRDIAYNLVDSIDHIVRAVLDGGTQKIWVNGGAVKITGGADGSVVAGDVLSSKVVRTAVTKFRDASVKTPRGTTFPVYVDPDVSADLQSETGSGGWRNPHEYVDPSNIYQGEVGTYLGASFIETPRCAVTADGSGGINVYTTYFMGAEAVAEASAIEPHVVIGPQTDKLRRFYPIGWHSLMGWSLYRPEALWLAKTSSNVVS